IKGSFSDPIAKYRKHPEIRRAMLPVRPETHANIHAVKARGGNVLIKLFWQLVRIGQAEEHDLHAAGQPIDHVLDVTVGCAGRSMQPRIRPGIDGANAFRLSGTIECRDEGILKLTLRIRRRDKGKVLRYIQSAFTLDHANSSRVVARVHDIG